jgi:hypothetical protein
MHDFSCSVFLIDGIHWQKYHVKSKIVCCHSAVFDNCTQARVRLHSLEVGFSAIVYFDEIMFLASSCYTDKL